MSSRIFNFIANKWTNSPDKKAPSEVDHLSGTSTPADTATITTAATSVHESASSPPSSVDASGSVADEVKMETEKDTNMELEDEVQKQEGQEEEDDDTEGMDLKAKALTKLLQTSSVGFTWIHMCMCVY